MFSSNEEVEGKSLSAEATHCKIQSTTVRYGEEEEEEEGGVGMTASMVTVVVVTVGLTVVMVT